MKSISDLETCESRMTDINFSLILLPRTFFNKAYKDNQIGEKQMKEVFDISKCTSKRIYNDARMDKVA